MNSRVPPRIILWFLVFKKLKGLRRYRYNVLRRVHPPLEWPQRCRVRRAEMTKQPHPIRPVGTDRAWSARVRSSCPAIPHSRAECWKSTPGSSRRRVA
jgi:hypothetical protein